MKQIYVRNLLVCLVLLLLLLLGFQLKAADYYWVGGAGSWSDLNHWSTTSGGTPNHSIIPNLNDDVHFDVNSGLVNSSIVDLPTASPAYCRNMTWVGVTTAANFLYRGRPLYVYGSVELAASVRYGTQGFNFVGSIPATMKMNGAARFNATGWRNYINVNKPGSSLTLLDGIPEGLVVFTVTLTAGSLDMSDFTHTFSNFSGNNTNTRSLDISNATINIGGTWDYRGNNSTINATNSYISAAIFNSDRFSFPKVDVTSVGGSSMVINNTTFGELTFTSPASPSQTVRIGSGNTIDRLEYKGGGSIAGGGNTIRELFIAPSNPGFSFVGNNSITGTLHANTPDCNALSQILGYGAGATITFGSGAVADVRNILMTDLAAAGSIPLPITVTGVDGGGNTGWDFQPRATGTTLYWVGGAGGWNDKSHWAASSGGAGGYCVPFTGDDVVFDANSGFVAGNNTVTATTGTAWCRNMTWTNVTGSPVLQVGGSFLHMYGSLVLDPTLAIYGNISFKGTEAATLTANGFTLGSPIFRVEKTGTDGGITFTDDITHTGFRIFHNSGKLLMPNRSLHLSQIGLEYSSARTMDISNSTITLEYEWNSNSSNTIWVNNGAGSFIDAKARFITNGLTYPKVQIGGTGNNVSIANANFTELLFTNTGLTFGTVALGGGNTIGTLEFKGAAEIRGNNTITNLLLAPSRNYNFRNTQTINGLFRYNNPDCSGLGELRGLEGVATLNFGPSSTKNMQNVLLQNIAATGAGVPVAVTGADAGGNSGFNFTASDSGPRYWVGGSGDWNDAAHWSATSGGAGGACVPTVTNDVFFDANSFSSGSSTVTIQQGHAYCRNMDWTGAAFSPVFNKNGSFNLEVWGSLVMNPAVQMNTPSSGNPMTFAGPANSTITPNGAGLGDFDFTIRKVNGSKFTFADNYNNANTNVDMLIGDLDLSGRTITVGYITDATTTGPVNMNITNATINGGWHAMGANTTVQATNSRIRGNLFRSSRGTYNKVEVTSTDDDLVNISNTTIDDLLFSSSNVNSQMYIGTQNTINRLEFKGRGTIVGTGNVINTLIFAPGKTYTFYSGTNTTINDAWYGSGSPCNPTQIVSSSTTNATVTKTNGTVDFDYIRLNRITAVSATPFKAREHSVDLGGNVNWDIAPYNNSASITGLGPDKILKNSEFPYTINTDGFFASPLAGFAWRKDGTPLSDTSNELVVTGPGTYAVDVTYPDGCSISDQIVLSRAAADLVVVKTASNMNPAVGSDVVFTLVATNNGPQESTGISVSDLLSAGYTYKSAVPPAGTTYDAGTGLWAIGTLASGASSTLTITATVNAAGPYANTASITGPEVDPEPANNSSSITPVPVPTADVSVVKTVDNGSPLVGSNVVFTLAVNNAGPSSATSVALTDLLPDGYTYVGAVVPAGTTYDPSTGLWTIGTLAKDANATATITATVKASGTYANTASVTLTENDPETNNNSSTVTPVPTPLANVSIVKTVNNSVPYAGNNVIFSLTASNAGPSSATGVKVNDLLPSGYTFVSSSPSLGTYNPSTGIWTIGTLANGANATLEITATVKDTGAFANTASITATETDPVTTNNSSTVTPTPIIIKVTKTGPSTVNAGDGVQYVLSVKNTGTGNALAAVISDIVPAELTNVSWTTAVQGTATITNGASGTGNNVSVTGNIPAGSANQIDISVSGTIPSSSLATSVSNTATVTASGSPVISSNTLITAIGREVDLHVQKAGPASVVAGSTVVYTLNVTNTGPSDASNVAVTDDIPAGLNNVTWTASAQNGAVINGAAAGTGDVNLSVFIPAGTASISVNITGTLDASYAAASLVNTATATPSAGVTDPTPASGTITSAVSRRANVRIIKSGPANIGAGETISYTIRVNNDGPSDVTGVEIRDLIPNEIETPTWTATVQGGATLSGLSGTGNINLTGSIPAGTGSIEITVSGQVSATLVDASTFSNTATANLPAGSPVTDPEPETNTSTISTVVNNTPNIRVSKNGPATVNIGDPITYTIVITNGGAGDVTGAVIKDNVPNSVTVSNWEIVAAAPATVTGISSGTSNTISTEGNIPADPQAKLTLTVQGTVNANADPTFTNKVNVTVGAIGESSVTTAVNQSTDIVVEKNGPQAVIAGRPISYTIKLGNAGPQKGQGLILKDAIPTAIENVSWSAAVVGSAVINGTSNGTGNAIEVNADVTAGAGNYVLITVNGTVAASTLPSTLTNTASVTLPPVGLTDFDLTNNTSVVETVVSRETNLAITKAVDNVAPDAGSNVVFTLMASNNGPSEATGVKVADPLPAGYTYVNSAPGAGTSYNSGTGEWTIGTLAIAASSTLTITATVNAAGSYANTATISGTEPDPILANNTATATPVPVPVTDLMITKAADNLTPDAGSNIVFTLVASNNGPSAATGVSVTDLLPGGYTYVGSTAAAGTTYDPVTGVWTIGTLANAASSSLTITATVKASGPYENTATISGTENDPATGNNTATVTPFASAVTDLAVTKTADNLSPDAGSNIVFTLVATNNGPSGATGVSVSDLLPAGYTYVSSTAPGTSYAPSTGIWTIGTLANTASTTLTITARVNAAGPYANTATISGTEPDHSTANNSATVTPAVTPVSDLAITKTADNLAPDAGSNVVFTLVATNNGPSGATGVSVTDLLPAGYTYVSSTPAAGTTYDPASGLWTIGTLANAASSNLTITARVNAAGPYANTASISGTEADPAAGNNTATVTPVPVPVSDLMVVKTADQANPDMGSSIVFTLVASNNGPSNGTGVEVTDLLPAGYTYVSSAPVAGTSYDPATGLWAIGALGNGASASLTITATVNSAGPYANSAVISGTETDLVTANNNSGVTPVPVPVTDLVVAKTADRPSVAVGSNIVFTVVASNNGPSEGTEVAVTDLLPGGYTYVSSVAEPGTSYDETTGIWTIGTLANGASSTLTVTATVNATGDYINTASISGAENDPETANNSATATVIAEPVSDLSITMTGSDLAPNTGSNMIFNIVATNNGPSDDTGVSVTDLLPAGYTYLSSTAEAGTTYNPATGLWTIGGLSAGTSVNLSITAKVNASGPYANTATISGAATDPDAGNNTVTVSPAPVSLADLNTVKSLKDPAQTSFIPGQAVVYTIRVTNNGPSEALSVNIQDIAPSGTTISSWITVPSAGVSYPNASGSGNLNETIPVLGNGMVAVYEVTVLTPANFTGTLTNTVQVGSPTADPVPGCTTCTTAPITPLPGEFMTWKTVATASGATKATAGEELIYTVHVRNTGQVLLSALNISSAVPANTTYISGGTLNGDVLTLGISNLAPGATATVSFRVRVNDNLVGVTAISSVATVSDGNTTKQTGGCDPAVAGCSLLPGTVIPVANNPLLGVSKSASEAVYQNDGSYLVTYTLKLANMGDVPLTNVQVPDDLKTVFPAPAQFNVEGSVEASGQLIANSGYDGTALVNLLSPGSSLGIGQEATIGFSVRIRPNRFFGPFNNQVTAMGIANGLTLTAQSSSGTNPDMNGDGIPDAASATPLTLKLVPLVVPNVFTPNGDNKNETLVIKGLDLYPDNELTVVNRWGNTVLVRKGYRNDWAATGLNEGTYFYLLKVKRESGDWEIYKGYVTLLRNK